MQQIKLKENTLFTLRVLNINQKAIEAQVSRIISDVLQKAGMKNIPGSATKLNLDLEKGVLEVGLSESKVVLPNNGKK